MATTKKIVLVMAALFTVSSLLFGCSSSTGTAETPDYTVSGVVVEVQKSAITIDVGSEKVPNWLKFEYARGCDLQLPQVGERVTLTVEIRNNFLLEDHKVVLIKTE